MTTSRLNEVQNWDSSNLLTAYPFSAEGGGRIEPTDVRSVVADMLVRRRTDEPDTQLKMTYLNVDPVDVRLETVAGAYVFDSRLVDVTRKSISWGGWTVIEITSQSPVFTVVQLVLSAAGVAAFTWPCTQQPVLLASRVTYGVRGVTRFGFQNPTEDPVWLDGAITLVAGYNTALTAKKGSPVRVPGQLSFDAQSGAGAGKLSDCSGAGDGAIHAINAIGPDSKNDFQLLADNQCYWFTRATAVVDGHMTLVQSKLQLINNCKPCCSCDDYVNVYNQLKILNGSADTLYVGAQRLHAKYQQFITLFASKTEALRQVRGSVNLFPRYNWRVGVQASLGNSTLQKVGATSYNILLQSTAQFELAPDSAYLYTASGGKEPVTLVAQADPGAGTVRYLLTADRMTGPGETALLEFEIYFTKGGTRASDTQISALAVFTWAEGSTTATTNATLPGPYNL